MTLQIVAGFLIYTALELFLRGSVLVYFTRLKYASWKLVTPHILMIVTPGYWIARNCKLSCEADSDSPELRTKLISNFNLWNLVVSGGILLIVLTARSEGYYLLDIVTSVVAWRFVSRSFEIAIAFGKDITTSSRKSTLDNGDRMGLALRSYLEIFVYSAAFYACFSSKWTGVGQPFLDSLYVGTLTNVSEVAKSLDLSPHWVFIQVFATLSLIILSIAGYLGGVKKIK